RSCERDALALPCRERPTAVSDHRLVGVGQLTDEVVRTCEPRGRSHPIAACTRVPEPDVVRDRAGEERRPLRYPREPAPPREQVRAVELLLAHRHATLGRRGQAEEQRGERALAAAARPDERDGLPGTQLEV